MENPRKIKLFGDRHEAMKNYGKGQALLRATEAISELLGLPYYRLFSADRTVISQTIPGMQSQIILSHTPELGIKEEEEENPSCTVYLFNVPVIIPPMMWYAPGEETFTKVGEVWVIRKPGGEIEVEGIDYIKTYYAVSVLDCSGCSSLDFTIGREIGAIESNSPYRPFWYRSEREDGRLIYTYEGAMVPHYMGNPDSIPPILPDPMNHMIYSLWASGQAEIIKADVDEGGSYILWRAYTEWSNVGPYVVDFSGTGLGYMLMQGFIQNEGMKLCESKPVIIKVDCCLKPEGERQVILYWESIGPGLAGGTTCTGQPFMFYGSIKVCEVPSVIGPLWAMLCTPRNTKYLYVIPEIKGGCLPFTWELNAGGGWTLVPSKPFGETAGLAYECTLGAPNCNESVDVTITDRCGRTDTFHSQSCCEQAAGGDGMSIGYTSLAMGLGASQTLTANGGCEPYSWSLGGGGELNTYTGPEVIYTAPETNPNCESNPTITLTDCCGNSAELKLAISNYDTQPALRKCTLLLCGTDPETGWMDLEAWDCAGISLGPACYYWTGSSMPWAYDGHCFCPGSSGPWEPPYDPCGWCSPAADCGLEDLRTQDEKDAGCCPINPFTGLPM